MAKEIINGQNGPVENAKRCSFSTFFLRVSRLLRALPAGFEFVKGETSFTMIRTYLDPYSGMAMIGCEKDDSIFSVSASEVYNDDSHVQLLVAYERLATKPYRLILPNDKLSTNEESN